MLDDTTEWMVSWSNWDIYPNNTIVVPYLIWADTKGKMWVFPEDAQLVETEAEQILMRNIHVT